MWILNNFSSFTHSPFFSYIICVKVIREGKKKLLKQSAGLPQSSYYKFYPVSFRINDCFPSPFSLILFSDLSWWPELSCLLFSEHLEGHTPRCFILQSPVQDSACCSQPTETCKQVLTRMNLLRTQYGKTGMLYHFLGIVSCLPHKLFLGFVCNNSIIKI